MRKNTLNRREVLKAGLITSASSLAGCGFNQEYQKRTAAKQPNLLFVFTDQQSRDMLGCYGNDQLITPNIDSFARDSVKFNHCVSSTPVCTPHRAMLMTGRHPLYNGCFANDVRLLKTNGAAFAEVLKKNGYRTGYFGKWHLYGGERDRPIPPGPHRHGFDVFKSNNCHTDYQPGKCFYFNEKGQKVFFDKWEPYSQTEQACRFVEDNAEQPFAAFVSWHPPHKVGVPGATDNYDPRGYINGAPQELLDLYRPDDIQLRPNVEDTPEIRKVYQGYMAMVTGIDNAFKMLIDKLKELGLYDNTIIVFTSDHGDMLNSHGRMSNKSCPELESIGVPLIIKLPESNRAGTSSDLLIGSMDMMPTTLSLMNISAPASVHGLDLANDIITGRDDTVKSVPLMLIAPAYRGVYTKRYTYATGTTYAPEGAPSAAMDANVLYDRQQDPYEMNNRFDDPEFKDIKKHLAELNQQWLDKFGDKFWDGEYVVNKLMGYDSKQFNQPGKKGVMTEPETMPIHIL